MKFYSLYVCDTRKLMEESIKAMRSFNLNTNDDEIANCSLNLELRALLAEGKSEDEIYAAICAHQEESHYDLFWSAAVFSPLTDLSNEQHQAVVAARMVQQFPDKVGLLSALNLHPAAKAIVDAALA